MNTCIQELIVALPLSCPTLPITGYSRMHLVRTLNIPRDRIDSERMGGVNKIPRQYFHNFHPFYNPVQKMTLSSTY